MKYDYIVCSINLNRYCICRTKEHYNFEYWNLEDVWLEDDQYIFTEEKEVCLKLLDLLLKDKNASE